MIYFVFQLDSEFNQKVEKIGHIFYSNFDNIYYTVSIKCAFDLLSHTFVASSVCAWRKDQMHSCTELILPPKTLSNL